MVRIAGSAICLACAHLEGDWCDAFPEGIPPDILGGWTDHRLPVEGDHGIRFLLLPGHEVALTRFENRNALLKRIFK